MNTVLHGPIPDLTISQIAIPDGALYVILTLISGIFWTLAYINIIYRGFKDKTAGMPLLVLGLNISWEFLFAFAGPPFLSADSYYAIAGQTVVQRAMDCMWFIFDCVIVYLKFKYGRDEYHKALPGFGEKLFKPYLCLIIFLSFLGVYTISVELNDHQGAYAAYLQNIFISSLYVQMLYRKGSTDGQSMYIAILKFFGTVAPSAMGAITCMLAYGISVGDFLKPAFMPLMKFLVIGCMIFDVTYIVLLYRQFKHEGKNPWTRKPLVTE